MLKRWLLILFVIDAIVEILAYVFDPIAIGVFNLHFVTKPLIVLLLMAYYQQSVLATDRLFLFALFFCWLGDVLLLFKGQLFFMMGLGSFLVAHIFLIVFYGRIKNNEGAGFNGPQKARASFPIVLISTGLITILYPILGDLKIPVIIYATAITVMVLRAITRYGYTSSKSFWCVGIGALFFLISDSLLALNKFSAPILYAGVWVMGTYIAAVYFITLGVIAHRSGL